LTLLPSGSQLGIGNKQVDDTVKTWSTARVWVTVLQEEADPAKFRWKGKLHDPSLDLPTDPLPRT
jgi:hypothetical protein